MRTLEDMVGADRDTVPPRDATSPSRSYIICATPRSGSTLLCHGLADTRVLGTPTEYFNPTRRPQLTERWGCASPPGPYVEALLRHRASREGVFGIKFQWDQLVLLHCELEGTPYAEPGYDLGAQLLERYFPGARYVRTLRRDVNRQAVSLWFAVQTEIWALDAGDGGGAAERRAVPYSFEGIERCRQLIENAEVHWDRFMRLNGIDAVEVVYEDLVADFAGTIAAVGAAILGPEVRFSTEQLRPGTRKLADDRSDEFQARFVADLADRGWQDPRR